MEQQFPPINSRRPRARKHSPYALRILKHDEPRCPPAAFAGIDLAAILRGTARSVLPLFGIQNCVQRGLGGADFLDRLCGSQFLLRTLRIHPCLHLRRPRHPFPRFLACPLRSHLSSFRVLLITHRPVFLFCYLDVEHALLRLVFHAPYITVPPFPFSPLTLLPPPVP